MPINIYEDTSLNKLAWLCDDNWELPTQLAALLEWVSVNKETLGKEKIVADIGLAIRKDGSGGGAVLATEEMKELIEANIDVYFSEYGQAWNDTSILG